MDKNIELREVEGFPNYYVGSDGNLYSDKQRKKALQSPNGVYKIQPKPHNKGYLEYGLFLNPKKRLWKRIHVLVAAAFLGEKPTPKHEVHHINNDKKDNRPENLQWVTRSENLYYSFYEHGREMMTRPIYYKGKYYTSIKALSIETDSSQKSINTTLSNMKKRGLSEIIYKGEVLKYATETKIKGPCVL